MRVCLAYDCLYPWTVGGAERWLRSLAENLAANGDEVTYLTRKQWEDGANPDIPGVEVIAISPHSKLYSADGTRRISEALSFGWGVFRFLRRHRADFDVVHVTATPFFGVFGARLALVGNTPPLFVDWDEAWTISYWVEYLGPVRGRVGWLLQSICARLSRRAFIESRLHEKRLREAGLSGELTMLPGLYDGPIKSSPGIASNPPLVLFAGRHIPEKRVLAIPGAIARARREIPELQCLILGDGPDHGKLLDEIQRTGMAESIQAPGFVETAEVQDAMGNASCLLLPSSREGYGIVVVEAAARGTPVILVEGSDNSAVELIEEGRNGFVAPDASAASLAAAIVSAVRGGQALRDETTTWFAERASTISVSNSSRIVAERHAAAVAGRVHQASTRS